MKKRTLPVVIAVLAWAFAGLSLYRAVTGGGIALLSAGIWVTCAAAWTLRTVRQIRYEKKTSNK